MKKLLLLCVFLLVASITSFAITVTVYNLTGCPYTLSVDGGVGYINVPANGNATGGNASTNPTTAKVGYVSGGSWLGQVNISNVSTFGTSTFVPPCMSSFYNCSWNQPSPTANVTIFIFP